MAKALMVVGTCSDAGKSVVVSALCRIAANSGIKVAPFKAQNMALNSYVTISGEEIGRSTAVQARACRLEPDWRVNPLLLKPIKDVASQVIIRGKVFKNMKASEYYEYKKEAFKVAKEGFDSLSKEYDLIIMEGAGSPAEINLWDKDIVNMPMAEYANAKVLLVGEIDRGGVFASIYGTIELFPEKWKKLMLGFILNRFRGDPNLLYNGIEMLEDLTKTKSFGILPYLKDMGLPEEDSVKQFKNRERQNSNALINIAVIVVPHISNFTDFEPFLFESDINIEFIYPKDDFSKYDALILPGSKSTIQDLAELKNENVEEKLNTYKGFIVGICGGLQMMGNEISDPLHIEGMQKFEKGFSLLDFSTIMKESKNLIRVAVKENLFNTNVEGYEIHQGESNTKDVIVGTKKCFGTYLHGIFDNDEFRHKFLDEIYLVKTGNKHSFNATYDVDKELDKFAEFVKRNIDCESLFASIGCPLSR